jgi:TatD DNase family protein
MSKHKKLAEKSAEESAIAYRVRNSLYLNITNRCSNICTFCPKFNEYRLYDNNLRLTVEPTFEEVMAAIGDPTEFDEIVFCGFGESLLRLELVVLIARELKLRYNCRIRINTDGQANLVYGRNIIPELAGLVDSISVSLNAPDAETYMQLCNTPFGVDGFSAVCDFIHLAKEQIPDVIASVVNIPGINIDACRELAQSLGASFRVRALS